MSGQLLWLTLAHTPGLGPTGCRRLLAHFGEIEPIFAAKTGELQAVAGIGPKVARAVAERTAMPQAEAELAKASKAGVHCLAFSDPAYPTLLREIADPPLVLYAKGNPELLSRPSIAVVGARAATIYGKKMAENFAAALARVGLTVTSGLALGIDTCAHQGALAANGATIAVLGCGLDVIYPPQNKKLFAMIATSGMLLSEYPLGTQPDSFRFPARNRIISGISQGVVVIEAAGRSGSLITAEFALEQGREVFAMPGRVDSGKSEGCHRLIQEGAKLVQRAEDILSELGAMLPEQTGATSTPALAAGPTKPPTATEAAILAVLDHYPRDIEEIIAACGLPAHTVTAALLGLELSGRVEASPGPQYRLNGQ